LHELYERKVPALCTRVRNHHIANPRLTLICFQVSHPRFSDWHPAVVSSSSVRLLVLVFNLAHNAYPFLHSRRSIVNRLPKELGSPLRLIAGHKRRCGMKTGIEVYRNRVVGLHRVLYGLESACMTSLHLGQGNGGPDLETGWRWACVARR
jgi:hypothetical protein